MSARWDRPAAALRRPEGEADEEFRLRLFSDTHGEAFAGLDPAMRDQLLRQQFAGQSASYRARFPHARSDIVECGGLPVGRIVTNETDGLLTLVDIALLPAWRGHGIGTRLIATLVAEAEAARWRVRLSVSRHNTGALRLYQRLGFSVIAADDVTATMERVAPERHVVPDRLRLPLAFDPAPLAAECKALATGWMNHFVTANYEGDWSVIPLRAKAGATHPVMMMLSDPGCRDYADTPALEICPAIRATLAQFRCPLDSVRLMRLGPGSVIKEHRDHDLAFEDGMVRFHLPVITHPGVVFTLNRSRVAMEAGSVWYLRLTDPHAVENPGPGERVHLVIDARVDPWVEALFASALAEAA